MGNQSRPEQPSEVERLRKENARLRADLDEATVTLTELKPSASQKPHVPDWLPEGTRDELERNGKAVNPFSGEKLGDWS